MIVDARALSRERRRGPGDELTLLGVRFDFLTRREAHAALGSALGRGEAWKVFIVNAHTINLSWEDPSFRRILNEADLVLNDGTGVGLASRFAVSRFPVTLVAPAWGPM